MQAMMIKRWTGVLRSLATACWEGVRGGVGRGEARVRKLSSYDKWTHSNKLQLCWLLHHAQLTFGKSPRFAKLGHFSIVKRQTQSISIKLQPAHICRTARTWIWDNRDKRRYEPGLKHLSLFLGSPEAGSIVVWVDRPLSVFGQLIGARCASERLPLVDRRLITHFELSNTNASCSMQEC